MTDEPTEASKDESAEEADRPARRSGARTNGGSHAEARPRPRSSATAHRPEPSPRPRPARPAQPARRTSTLLPATSGSGDLEHAEAEHLELHQGRIGSATARAVTVHQGAVGGAQ